MRHRLAAILATAALLLAVPAHAQGQGRDGMTRGQVRSMLVTALQLELLARACDFYMTPAQRIDIGKIRQSAAEALQLTGEKVGAIRGELDAMLARDRDRICVEDERVYRDTLDALTGGGR